MTKIFNLLF